MADATERTETVPVMSVTTLKDGEVLSRRTPHIRRTFRREPIKVVNAAEPRALEDLLGSSQFDGVPAVACFASKGLMPLEEVRYLLLWGNQLTMSPGERDFDYPTSEFLLGMARAYTSKYSGNSPLYQLREGVEAASAESMADVVTLPQAEFATFLEQFDESTPREELMTALDDFVGTYM